MLCKWVIFYKPNILVKCVSKTLCSKEKFNSKNLCEEIRKYFLLMETEKDSDLLDYCQHFGKAFYKTVYKNHFIKHC